jgi:hypothetical protein
MSFKECLMLGSFVFRIDKPQSRSALRNITYWRLVAAYLKSLLKWLYS